MWSHSRVWGVVLVSVAAAFSMAPARHIFPGPPVIRVEIDGVSVGSFAAIDGPGLELEVLEFREGGESGPARKLPGRTKYLNVTLKRGWVSPSYFEDWIEQVRAGDEGFRKSVVIVLADRAGRELARYTLFAAWPSKWKLTTFDDGAVGPLMEELSITTESFDKS